MRLFLAIDVDETVRRGVGRLAGVVREALDRVDRRWSRGVKWVDPSVVHLTLHFLGEVGDADARRLRRALEPPLAAAAFQVEFGGLGVFPPSGPARVLWVGASRGAGAVSALHALVGDRLAGLAVHCEHRDFHPHLTLGRFREPARGDVRGAIASVAETSAGACLVSAVTLFRSHLAPSGPTYEVLSRTPLAG